MRYAVYATPARGTALAEVAAAWLGRDAFNGADFAPPRVAGIADERMRTITADPRRYGFHGTLKAPFALAAGTDEADLRAAFADFARARTAVSLRLAVGRIGGFLAIVPARNAPQLHALADAAVEVFDRFRAPAAAEDLARRRRGGLTPSEHAHLDRWGYPYVFSDFRFHMTLTCRLVEPELATVEAAAKAIFEPLLANPFVLDTLALFAEPAPGAPFTVIDTAPLLAHPEAVIL